MGIRSDLTKIMGSIDGLKKEVDAVLKAYEAKKAKFDQSMNKIQTAAAAVAKEAKQNSPAPNTLQAAAAAIAAECKTAAAAAN
jgi:hypothetical protein